jgi:type IV pilus assembly protein PilO
MDPKIEKILKLPLKQRIAFHLVVLLLEGAAFFFGLIQPKLKQLQESQSKLASVQNQVQESRRIATNLVRYKKEYEQLKKDLDAALTELPNQKEIPTLLTSITNAGKAAGLDFLLFRPQAEEPKDFYSVVPVNITVSGSFYNVANFFIAVSNLPRIVNIKNVVFSDIQTEQGRSKVKVNCLATTFRFLEKKESSDAKKASK